MKHYFAAITILILCAGLAGAQAQFGPRGGGMMGGQPQGPDFSGPLAKLFDGSPTFSAKLDMQITSASSGGNPSLSIGNIAVSGGKSRFEVDMAKSAGSRMSPQHAANLKAMGFTPVILISRPDLKVTYLVYPGLNAYVEMAATNPADKGHYKVLTAVLGREGVDGHLCVKNKVVVTDDKGVQHESTVWNATDLNNFPVKIESNEQGIAISMTFSDIKFDKVAPGQFEAPSGASKYGDMQSMLQTEIMKRARPARVSFGTN